MKGDLFMQIYNNVQTPQQHFGMALKIDKGAAKDLKNLSMDIIEDLQKAGEELKDTKFFHVRVDKNLGASIESDNDAPYGLFKGDKYFANRYGECKVNGKMVPDERIIMIENDNGAIAGVGRYVPYGKKPFYNVWNGLGSLGNVKDIKTLSKVAKILDEAAKTKYAEQVKTLANEKNAQMKVSDAVDKLMDTFGE